MQKVINTEGLDEQIRCAMCRNPMHTDRGCDGNCKYDEKLYAKIIQILGERISAEPEIIRCRDCKYSSPNRVYGCRLEPFDVNERDERMYSNDYCSNAILRGETDE